jgi:undecaprenyl-diphosphatase
MVKKKRLAKKQKNTKLLIVLILFILLVSASFAFDYQIVEKTSRLRSSSLDVFMLWITFFGSTFFILFFLTSLFLWREHKRRWIVPLWLSLSASFVITSILKFLVARARPYQLGIATLDLLRYSNTINSSFPSFHAAAAFSALPVLDKEFPRFKFVWLGFAFIVAFSRIYFAVHYLSDVLTGAFIGYLIGYIAVRFEEKYKYSNIKKTMCHHTRKNLLIFGA